jgi:hypothetical protein
LPDSVTHHPGGLVWHPGHGPAKIISGLMRKSRETGHARRRATKKAMGNESQYRAPKDKCVPARNSSQLKKKLRPLGPKIINSRCESFIRLHRTPGIIRSSKKLSEHDRVRVSGRVPAVGVSSVKAMRIKKCAFRGKRLGSRRESMLLVWPK